MPGFNLKSTKCHVMYSDGSLIMCLCIASQHQGEAEEKGAEHGFKLVFGDLVRFL